MLTRYSSTMPANMELNTSINLAMATPVRKLFSSCAYAAARASEYNMGTRTVATMLVVLFSGLSWSHATLKYLRLNAARWALVGAQLSCM